MNKECFKCLYNCKNENRFKITKCKLNKLRSDKNDFKK